MTPEENARKQWQKQEEVTLPDIKELRSRNSKLYRKVFWRNAVEYAAGALLVVAFGAMLLTIPLWPVKVASAVSLIAVVYVMWQLHSRASAQRADGERALGAMPLIGHQRRQLARQRDALASIFSWYLAPFLPGLVLFYAAPFLMLPVERWELPPLNIWLYLGGTLALFGIIWMANKAAANRLQKEIDEIDALLAE